MHKYNVRKFMHHQWYQKNIFKTFHEFYLFIYFFYLFFFFFFLFFSLFISFQWAYSQVTVVRPFVVHHHYFKVASSFNLSSRILPDFTYRIYRQAEPIYLLSLSLKNFGCNGHRLKIRRKKKFIALLIHIIQKCLFSSPLPNTLGKTSNYTDFELR